MLGIFLCSVFGIIIISALLQFLLKKFFIWLKKDICELDLSGTVSVNGNSSVSIFLPPNRPPCKVVVEFADDPNNHPCNHEEDSFSWEIVKVEQSYELVIYFNVSNIRTISYTVSYR